MSISTSSSVRDFLTERMLPWNGYQALSLDECWVKAC